VESYIYMYICEKQNSWDLKPVREYFLCYTEFICVLFV